MKCVFALEYTMNPFGGLSCERSIQILAKAVKERLKMRGEAERKFTEWRMQCQPAKTFPCLSA